ncbi:methyltransferase TYW3-domain-containing protein [Biscogniauxia sp. FL1348]|nr:methyltransferase TYW3-domain-containing protein [Biscogniauxia sp. FL1348]
MEGLPQPPLQFVQRKTRILEKLGVPEAEYTDASPKGSIDAGIRDLIDEINGLDGFVTTSSCAGRVSVFVEGRKTAARASDSDVRHDDDDDDDDDAERGAEEAGARERDASLPAEKLAGVGGKGGGGTWLFVSHDPVVWGNADGGLEGLFGLSNDHEAAGLEGNRGGAGSRLIHFKFEPMILHVLTASPNHAQLLLRCGLQAGFRESGAINLVSAAGEPVTPIVAIRSMGLALESLVGVQHAYGAPTCTVPQEYLQTLLRVSNERFEENKKRIIRFRAAVLQAAKPPKKKDGSEWEDARARRERKKAEGLRRKAELQTRQKQTGEDENVEEDSSVLGLLSNTDLT